MFHVISACSISRYKTIQLNVLLLNQFQLLTLNCFIIISCCYDIFNILSSATVLLTAIVRIDCRHWDNYCRSTFNNCRPNSHAVDIDYGCCDVVQ